MRAWLEGPYRRKVAQSFQRRSHPLASPHSDGRKVSSVPSGAVDWFIGISCPWWSLCPQVSFHQYFGRPGSNGRTPQMTVPALDGNYYMVLRHRNHLTSMGASSMMFNNSPASLFSFSSVSIDGMDRSKPRHPTWNRRVRHGRRRRGRIRLR
jgi:hypothetical protein